MHVLRLLIDTGSVYTVLPIAVLESIGTGCSDSDPAPEPVHVPVRGDPDLDGICYSWGHSAGCRRLYRPATPWVQLARLRPLLAGGPELYVDTPAHREPIVRNFRTDPFHAPIFTYPFGGGEPPGSYTWLAAFTAPETGNLIGEIVQVLFTFCP